VIAERASCKAINFEEQSPFVERDLM